ncbi:MAG: DNA repair protein RecN [Acidimicrobiia bacterium]
MLDELSLRNAGILNAATIEPGPGLTVITGESGAGKTLLIGALRLLVGDTARRDQIGPGGDELVAEGRFVQDDTETVARRRVGKEGRSRSYLDGAMVPARRLAEVIGGRIELVAQHDAMLLARPDGARSLVDGALDAAGRGLLADYREAYGRLAAIKARLRANGGDLRALERELDMVRFQADEIATAAFSEGEDAALAARAIRLRNAEAAAEGLAAAAAALGEDRGAVDRLGEALGEVTRLAALDPGFEALRLQLLEAAATLDATHNEVARFAVELDRDPSDLEETEQRLALLGDLQRKYGASLDDVLAFAAAAEARSAELVAGLAEAESDAEALIKATTVLGEAGEGLREARVEAASRLSQSAVAHLRELGFSDPTVHIEVTPSAPAADGADRIVLMFASDGALTPAPVRSIASGGELSRLVLALRLSSANGATPIVAFDEVDAGIAGATALALGRKLVRLAKDRQVLCITHLPQVAAHASTHYAVRRDGPTALVVRVDGEERVEELARMLAGLPDSEKGREHAAELLAQASA